MHIKNVQPDLTINNIISKPKMTNRQTKLSFAQMWNLSFGFFGVQIAYSLQSANISRIFATLGADPHQLSFFWILPPLMGMLVQPLIGKWSDRTWCRMGRRKPYLLVGALVAVIVMAFLPNAGSLNFSSRLILGLNGAMWFGLFSLIFLDTSINVAMQPFKMMVSDMVGEEQKAQARQRQTWEREVKAAEEEIVQLEAAIAVLESQMATPEGSQDMSLYEKHSKFKKQLSDAEERWAEALEKV